MKLKKVLSLLLALVMTVSLLTLPAHAEDAGAEEGETAPAQEVTIPQTVVFTDAGPFMPPVNVPHTYFGPMKAAAAGTAKGNGLELSKDVKVSDDGYTITLEAYTTGEVITSTRTSPVDIVLVLDQSGSMKYDFSGNSTNTDTARRQYAMKQAVNNFIDAVNEKYDAEKSDHRMAIVTFGTNASILQNWISVDGAGKATLQSEVNKLPTQPNGATNVAAGMTQAETLMGSGYNYTGTNTQRQKVVIVFTDGVPTTSSDFDTTVATNAIASAKNLKDAGATVYTVGIFTGANPDELYGSSGFGRNSNGTVGSDWSNFSFWMIGDIQSYDVPAGNRFLNFLSSNFSSASEIGIKTYRKTFLGVGYRGWEITKNFDRTASNYYLTANDGDSLNKIFQTISDNIQTANIDLDSKTVVRDTVSKYFDLPADTSAIKLYTADAKADGTFADRVPATGVTPKIDGNAVSVTGFDFNANFVSDKPKADGTYGKKLIIEFTVTPKDGFIGGNDVPTNDWKSSGVYDKSGTEVEGFADEDTTPTVNVPIAEPVFAANDKTIYQGNSLTVDGLYTLPDTTGWQYDFVNVTAGVTGVTEEIIAPEDCTSYEVEVTYAPKTGGTGSEGTANDMAGVSKEETATVHVLKPTVTATVNDVERYYGESYTLGDGANGQITVNWTDSNNHQGIPAVTGTAPYTAADLSLAYTTQAFDGMTGTVPKTDFDVTVKVMKGGNEMPATITTNCSFGCGTATGSTYTVHIKTCTLSITKKGGEGDETYVFDVYKDDEKYSEVTIQGNGTETLVELPVGTYTIEEDTNWSWRYDKAPSYTADVVLSSDVPTGTITCTNAKTTNSWLNGFSTVVRNIFGKN